MGPEVQQLRTYGNFRRPRSAGLGGLGLIPTAVLFVFLAIAGTLAPLDMVLALIVALVGAVVLVPLAVRDRYGRHLGTLMYSRLAWGVGVMKGQNVYRSGVLSKVPGGKSLLPGLAMASDMYEATDGLGRPFGMIHYHEVEHYAVTIACSSQGGSLVDQGDIDSWVANWGQFMRTMSGEPSLVGFQVVVEVAPDSGEKLHNEITHQASDTASRLARQVMADIDRDYPSGSPTINTYLSLVYDASSAIGRSKRAASDMAVEIGRRLPSLTARLATTGAGACAPLSATEIAEVVRTAYEPGVSQLIDQARAAGRDSGLTWSQAGPTTHVAKSKSYWHDGATSVTWMMGEAPRGEVFSDVLRNLLSAHGDIDRKRVSLIYRPHSPAEAATIADRDFRAARSRTETTRNGQAHAEAEYIAAAQTRQEEARGAGLTLFGLVVTATVLDNDDEADERNGEGGGKNRMQAAEVAVENLSAPARIALRYAWGSQDAGFLAALPIGVILPEHMTMKLPKTLK
ncbi:SCO6880 family protein [Streptomyces triculaminicus]|uniref:SCO6880 family protein n=1 Tax=Streptomyces triculaminicus TaxID=2816232 RepID=UPI003400A444